MRASPPPGIRAAASASEAGAPAGPRGATGETTTALGASAQPRRGRHRAGIHRTDRALHRPGERDRERVESGREPPEHSRSLDAPARPASSASARARRASRDRPRRGVRARARRAAHRSARPQPRRPPPRRQPAPRAVRRSRTPPPRRASDSAISIAASIAETMRRRATSITYAAVKAESRMPARRCAAEPTTCAISSSSDGEARESSRRRAQRRRVDGDGPAAADVEVIAHAPHHQG